MVARHIALHDDGIDQSATRCPYQFSGRVCGLYELSRRRELGLDTSWRHAFDIIHSPSLWSIVALGSLLLVIFAVWLAVANAIYVSNFGEGQPR
jgi:uncharacterized membrane protein